MRDESPDDVSRLADAIDAFLERGGRGESGSDSAYLAEHEELREFLEPMLEAGTTMGDRPEEVPVRLGPYRVREELGRGGMGVVYLAEHETLHREVALKVLPQLSSLSPRRIERFLREAAAAARLDHPGIARIFDAGQHEGTFYYTMELVPGGSLRDQLQRILRRCQRDPRRLQDVPQFGVPGCRTRADEIAELGLQIADALSHAHEHGVIHRDVKPQNLVLDSDGHARLIDFGLAKDLAFEATMSGDFAGTPHYASPEQVDGRGIKIDGRADVFALGVVLYELATLRRPFDGSSSGSVLRAVLDEDPRPIRVLDPRLPRDLEAIVQQALEKRPDARYASAAEFAADLRRLRSGEPVRARRTVWMRRVARRLRRNPWVTATVAMAILLFVGAPTAGLIYSTNKNAEIEHERTLAEQHFARSRDVVNRLLTNVATQQLPDVPHVQEFRLQLLVEARDVQLELLATTDIDDPRVRHDLARCHMRVGEVKVELGRTDALDEFRAAVAILHDVATAEPDNPALRHDIAAAESNLVRSLALVGRVDEATAQQETARRAWVDALTALQPLPRLRDVALLERARAEAYWSSVVRFRDAEAAEQCLARATLDLEAVAAKDRLDDRRKIRLRRAHAQVAMMRSELAADRDDLEGRQRWIDAVFEHLDEPSPAMRKASWYPAKLGNALIQRHQLHLANGDRDAAETDLLAAQKLARDLENRFPSSDDYRAERIYRDALRARFLIHSRRFDEAIPLAHAAAKDALALSRKSQRDSIVRVLALSLTPSIMVSLFYDPDVERAVETLSSEIELLESIVDVNDEHAAMISELGTAYHHRAIGMLNLQRNTEALFDAQTAVTTQHRATVLAPHRVTYRRFLFKHRQMLTEAALREREWGIAAATLAKLVETTERPDTLVHAAATILRCASEGDDEHADERIDSALDALQRARDTDQKLVRGLDADPRFELVHTDDRFLDIVIDQTEDR